MITEDQITIGVELEMLLCGLPKNTPENEEFELVAQSMIPLAEKLGACVINTATMPGAYPDDEVLVQAFNIQCDTTIDTRDPSGRGVEVATPILRSDQWRTVIPEMCQVLKKNFRLRFNSSTGLHVHVGIGRNYTLLDLRRISKAIIIFEAQMDTYHPRCRSLEAVMGFSNQKFIRSNRHNRVFNGLSDSECMEVLDEPLEIDELLRQINCNPVVRYMSHKRFYKYNLTSVMNYGTIEFRQAIATDDGDQIVDWVGRVILFVTSAISTPDEVFDTWARDGVNDSDVYRRFGIPIPA